MGLALAVVAVLLFVAQQAAITLQTLTRVERERDSWQRPEQILEALNLRPGVTAVDLGSGAGYFALKMAPLVAPDGRVLAIDLRRQSLAFLWLRAMLRGSGNLQVIRSETDDPRLPRVPIDAVLVANTYHELTKPEPVMKALFTAMRPGATLVVADRAPHDGESGSASTSHHHIAARDVERALTALGFHIVRKDDRFIERDADGDSWWLIVFRRP